MVSDGIKRLLNEIGRLLNQDPDYPNEEVLLYAEVGDNVVSGSIFKNLADQILYRNDWDRLADPLLDLWEETDPDKRWAEMDFVLRDGKFTVAFVYPDDIDVEEDPFERRDRVVRRHFGDKPIVYPPMPDIGELYEL